MALLETTWIRKTLAALITRLAAAAGISPHLNETALGFFINSLLVGAVPVLWYRNKISQSQIRSGVLLPLKVITGFIAIAIEVADIKLRKPGTADWTHLPIPNTSLSLLASLCAASIQSITHSQRMGSSPILAIWLAVSIFCHVLHSQVILIHSGYRTLEFSFAAATATVKAAMLFLDEMPKHALIINDTARQSISKASTTGFWSRVVFLWLTKTFVFGFRNKKASRPDSLEAQHRSRRLLTQFKAKWKSVDRKSRYALLSTCVQVAPWQFFLVIPARLSHIMFHLMQPYLIRSIVDYTMGPYKVDYEMRTAASLMVLGIVVYGGIMLSKVTYMKLNSDLEGIFRGMLVSAIYEKSLSLPLSNNEQVNANDLVNGEVAEIVDGLSTFQTFWANIVTSFFGLCFLLTMMGQVSFIIVVFLLACMVSERYVTRKLRDARGKWVTSTKERVAQVSEMVSQIKSLKMVGLDGLVVNQIRSLRGKEITELIRARSWMTFHMAKSSIQLIFTPALLLFCGLWWSDWKATPANVYAAFTTLNMVAYTSHFIIRFWPQLFSVLESTERVAAYLLRREMDNQHHRRLVIAGQDPLNLQVEDDRPESLVFELQHASIAPYEDTRAILRNINLYVYRRSITMVVGATGSGKSTLLRMAIGEAKLVAGKRYKQHLHGTYCGQRVWLENKTIRENIVSCYPMNARWYSEVLHACQLRPDLRNLPKSDLTVITGNGSNLSGGQKHRIALARALYPKPALLILDNVFSSLDRQTAVNICTLLFGRLGLARQLNTTVVMSAHTPQCLDFATNFIFIDNEENVIQRESRDDDVPQYLRAVFGQDALDNQVLPATDNPADDDRVEAIHETPTQLASIAEKANLTRSSNLKPYLFYLQSFTFLQCISFLISSAFVSVVEMSPGGYIRIWLEASLPKSVFFAVGYCLFCIVNVLCATWNISTIYLRVVPSSSEYFHELLLKTTTGATLQHLTAMRPAVTMSLFAGDISAISNELPTFLLRAVYGTGNVLAQVCIMVYCIPEVISFSFCLLIVLYFMRRRYHQILRRVRHTELDMKSALQVRLIETTYGIEHIRAFRRKPQALEQTLKSLDKIQAASYDMDTITRWMTLHLSIITLLFGMFLVIRAISSPKTVSGPDIGLALAILATLSSEMNSYIETTTGLELSLGSVARIQDYQASTPQEKPPKETIDLPKNWPRTGGVVINNVTAKYNSAEDAPEILKSVSTSIPPGQKVGIVGRTGSGKTSLLMTLLNFLKYTGSIEIDGVDVSKISPAVLRSSITTVSQDFISFNSSVRFNLCPWTINEVTEESKASEANAIKLMKAIGLWQLAAKHGGLNAEVSALGLSHGQKQLMCIVRACLQQSFSGSRLVIMDEPMSDLDTDMLETAKSIMDEAFRSCTIIVVAHRPETLDNMDVILHMRDGRIVRRELLNAGLSQ